MKTKSFLYGLCALALMASCSKDGDVVAPTSKSVEGMPAPMVVNVNEANFAGGRATDPQLASESTISDLTIMAFRSDGKLDAFASGVTPTIANNVYTYQMNNTTTAADSMIVIANAPSGVFNSGMNKQAAKLAVMELQSADSQNSKLVMATTVPVKLSLKATETASENVVTATVSRMAAKIQLEGITVNLDADSYPAGTTLTITDVYLANVNNIYRAVSDEILATPLLNMVVDNNYNAGWGAQMPNTPTWPMYYYVAPNPKDETGVAEDAIDNLWSNSTMLIIKGSFYEPGVATPKAVGEIAPTTTDVYYTIFVNRALAGTILTAGGVDGTNPGITGNGVKANTIYSINVTIKKKGTYNPGEKILPAACTVNVTVNPWYSVTQNVIF